MSSSQPSESSSSRAGVEDQTTSGTIATTTATSPFLSHDNLCGQTLLELVGRAHSILANIRILSEQVPPAFLAAAELSSGKGGSAQGAGKGGAGTSANKSEGFLNIFGQTSARSSHGVDNQNNEETSSSGGGDTDDVKKYIPFLFDFSYLHNPEEWEASLSLPPSKGETGKDGQTAQAADAANEPPENIADLEREFAVNHKASIEQYYALFYSIYEYQVDLNRFSDDLTKGFFIQYTVESLLLDLEGRALLCEAVWLYGVMLILMERLLPVSAVALDAAHGGS